MTPPLITKKLFLWSYNLHNTVNRKLGVISPNYERELRVFILTRNVKRVNLIYKLLYFLILNDYFNEFEKVVSYSSQTDSFKQNFKR